MLEFIVTIDSSLISATRHTDVAPIRRCVTPYGPSPRCLDRHPILYALLKSLLSQIGLRDGKRVTFLKPTDW